MAYPSSPKQTFQAPGLPPVSMDPADLKLTLEQRIARDQAATDASGTVQRPDAYMDPEQALAMLQYHVAEAKKSGNANAVAYFQGELDKMMQAENAQAQRLYKTYGVKP